MLNLDWHSDETFHFVNPRLSDKDRIKLGTPENDLKGHVILTTSGSKDLSWVALSKQAFISSALAVNKHLDVSSQDIWINALPHFHVGGLSIYARSYIANNYVHRYDQRWNPTNWVNFINEKKGTLTSLVPAQVWDLVEHRITCPKSLRVLLVGGQKLPLELYEKAKALGWPVMPTFGMTECCSQVATADLDSPQLRLLSHVEGRITKNGRLAIKSPALFTGYLKPHLIDPKYAGWFETEDRASLEDDIIIPTGRVNDIIKIKGELINVYDLEARLQVLKNRLDVRAELTLVPIKDERNGYLLRLFHSPYNVTSLIEQFNLEVIPEARIFHHTELEELPKTAIGKIAKEQLALFATNS